MLLSLLLVLLPLLYVTYVQCRLCIDICSGFSFVMACYTSGVFSVLLVFVVHFLFGVVVVYAILLVFQFSSMTWEVFYCLSIFSVCSTYLLSVCSVVSVCIVRMFSGYLFCCLYVQYC